MRRSFPILAGVAGLLLVASLVSGIVAPGVGRVHLAMIAAGATIGIYALMSIYLGLTGKRVEAMARRLDLPGWVGAQAEKNRRKAFAYGWWGLPMLMATVWSDVIVGDWPGSHGLSAMNLAFQLGAFLGMSVVVVAQERLIRDVGTWASPS